MLDRDIIVDVGVLEHLVDSRLNEARALQRAACHAGCVYLAGYAVECGLKVAICKALDCDGLPATFASHELEVLLLHSGLDRRMKRDAPQVHQNFAQIQEVWKMAKHKSIRYRDPKEFSSEDAEEFLSWVTEPNHGVVPWLRRQQ